MEKTLILRAMLPGLALLLLAGCATFETSPEDVQNKLMSPTKGHLYERDPNSSY